MATKTKARSGKPSSVRQSVTLPAKLAMEVRRVAKERRLTTSRALVELAQRGIEAEAEAKEKLSATYRRFMSEDDPERKAEAGKDLIRAIFGTPGRAIEAHAATLLEEAVHFPATTNQARFDKERAKAAGARIRELRKGVALGGLTIRELIEEGRR